MDHKKQVENKLCLLQEKAPLKPFVVFREDGFMLTRDGLFGWESCCFLANVKIKRDETHWKTIELNQIPSALQLVLFHRSCFHILLFLANRHRFSLELFCIRILYACTLSTFQNPHCSLFKLWSFRSGNLGKKWNWVCLESPSTPQVSAKSAKSPWYLLLPVTPVYECCLCIGISVYQ